MFRSRFRLNSCKIILVTSFVWFIVDIIILAFYFDSLSNLSKSKYVEKSGNTSESISQAEPLKLEKINLDEAEKESETGISLTYKPIDLSRWVPAKPVPPQQGKPGELGNGVQIPADQDALMKEKFKLNQFNILASDKISLNRSLLDVRHGRLVRAYSIIRIIHLWL